MAKNMSECLEEAAVLLEQVGWTQERFYAGDLEHPTAYCMIGACKAVCPERDASTPFALVLGFKQGPIYDAADVAFIWNDRKKRKKEEVVARLRHYAALERDKEASSV